MSAVLRSTHKNYLKEIYLKTGEEPTVLLIFSLILKKRIKTEEFVSPYLGTSKTMNAPPPGTPTAPSSSPPQKKSGKEYRRDDSFFSSPSSLFLDHWSITREGEREIRGR